MTLDLAVVCLSFLETKPSLEGQTVFLIELSQDLLSVKI